MRVDMQLPYNDLKFTIEIRCYRGLFLHLSFNYLSCQTILADIQLTPI